MKKLVLILLLLPTLGKAQTTMVWESKIHNIYYHIELEQTTNVFQFTISDPTIGEEIDYWVTGLWTQLNDGSYQCYVRKGQNKNEFPKLFRITPGKSFQYKGKYIEWKENRTTTQQ
jgi:hypothetical protein